MDIKFLSKKIKLISKQIVTILMDIKSRFFFQYITYLFDFEL